MSWQMSSSNKYATQEAEKTNKQIAVKSLKCSSTSRAERAGGKVDAKIGIEASSGN